MAQPQCPWNDAQLFHMSLECSNYAVAACTDYYRSMPSLVTAKDWDELLKFMEWEQEDLMEPDRMPAKFCAEVVSQHILEYVIESGNPPVEFKCELPELPETTPISILTRAFLNPVEVELRTLIKNDLLSKELALFSLDFNAFYAYATRLGNHYFDLLYDECAIRLKHILNSIQIIFQRLKTLATDYPRFVQDITNLLFAYRHVILLMQELHGISEDHYYREGPDEDDDMDNNDEQ